MNKKAFTLVELLAVIAILAILVIIALPNVMSLFNDAKKNSFLNEVKTIYKTAQQSWFTDSVFSNEEQIYSRCSSCTGKSLKLSGRTGIDYYIKLNKSGEVVKYYVTDGVYQYSYNDDEPLTVESITDAQTVADLASNQIITITSEGVQDGSIYYVFYNGFDRYNIGDDVPTESVYDNYTDVINSMKYWRNEEEGYKFFSRLKIVEEKISQIEMGYYINNSVYYLKGLDPNVYESNKSILDNSFPSGKCNERTSTSNGKTIYQYTCYVAGDENVPGLYIGIWDDGQINAFDSISGNSEWSCMIYFNPTGINCTYPY